MSWTAEQERQFLEMQAQRNEAYQMHRAGLEMAIRDSGLGSLIMPNLIEHAPAIIKALEPFAALKEQK